VKGYAFLPRPTPALTFGELAIGERFVFILQNGEDAPESGNPHYRTVSRTKATARAYTVTWQDGASQTMPVSGHALVRRPRTEEA
jgi:hypothetical protein